MKKSFLLILIVALLFPFAVCAEEEILLPEAEPSVARIGNDELAFINRQDYYDLSYKYPGEFELEINGYEQVPHDVQQRLAAEYQEKRNSGER